jgi:hypothetical protein
VRSTPRTNAPQAASHRCTDKAGIVLLIDIGLALLQFFNGHPASS